MKVIELTDSIVEWMTDHYGLVSRKECAKHLMVSTTTIDRWARQLGLSKKINHNKKKEAKVVEVPVEVEKGYCIDCKHYVAGGYCGRTNRHTGALNEKTCFKKITL